jgi:DNA-binding NarL/FixJ family response regulator
MGRSSEETIPRHVLEQRLQPARAALSRDAAAEAWAQGAAMADEELGRYALADEPDAPPDTRDLVAISPVHHSAGGGTPIPSRAARDGKLSPREIEVAALVAEGLTNPQIAAQLIISQRTVGRHMEHILNKLGFSTRAQVAAWIASRR